VLEALRSGRARRVVVAAGSRSTEALRAVLAEADRSNVAMRWVPREELDALGLHEAQGVAAYIDLPRELDERALVTTTHPHDAVLVCLDGITDPQNLGTCARAAEAAGVSMLVARRRRAAPVSPAAIRASAGALLHLPLARVPNLPRAIDRLKDLGFTVVGLDQRAGRTIHDATPPERPIALVVGAEDTGISRLVREACDVMVSIPMSGRTGSLNAAAALAVGLFGFVLRPAGSAEPAGTMPGDAGVAQSGSASDL
jgi:23S rRNA (guanosine2251-2'-O)-methyltransferase